MENIFIVSKPFLVFAKVLGYFPMSFSKHATNGRFKIKWFDVLISCCWCLFIVAVNVTVLFSKQIVLSKSAFLVKAWSISRSAELILYFDLFCCQIYNRRNILKYLTLIYDFDEEVSCSKTFRTAVSYKNCHFRQNHSKFL